MSNKDTFKQLLSETVKGIIWKIVLDDMEQILLVESRTEQKEVYFYAFDFKNGHFLMKEKTFEEKWLIGISGIHKGIAYFYGFENEFSPGRKGIMALNLYTRQIVWENYNYVLESLSKDGILAFNAKIQPKRFELLNLETGLLLKNIRQEEVSEYLSISNDIKIPESHFEDEITNNFQKLKINGLDIKASYLKEGESINHILEIFKEGNLIFTDYLSRNIQKVVPDTFFVWFDKLVYIRDKSEIVVYLL